MKPIFQKLLTYATIIGMAILGALNYVLFVFPNSFAPSGLNGLLTIIQYLFHFSMGYLSLLINIPLALLAWKFTNRRLAVRSLVYVVTFSLALLVFERMPLDRFAYDTENGTSTILGPMVAGIINGFFYSQVLRIGGTTGGMDFVAVLIHKRNPERDLMQVIFIINVFVAIISYFVYNYKVEPVILCILYSFLTSTVSDSVMRNGRSAIRFEIVTDDPKAISDEIIHQLGHSATLLHGTGMYSGQERNMLVCVVNRRQVAELQKIIKAHPGTFACMSQVGQVVGNFKHIRKDGKEENKLLDIAVDETV